MGISEDDGATWGWTPVTWNSEVDNLRPVVPAWDDDHTAVLWLRGAVESYRSWDSQVVGKIVRTDALESLGVPVERK